MQTNTSPDYENNSLNQQHLQQMEHLKNYRDRSVSGEFEFVRSGQDIRLWIDLSNHEKGGCYVDLDKATVQAMAETLGLSRVAPEESEDAFDALNPKLFHYDPNGYPKGIPIYTVPQNKPRGAGSSVYVPILQDVIDRNLPGAQVVSEKGGMVLGNLQSQLKRAIIQLDFEHLWIATTIGGKVYFKRKGE